MEWEDQSPFKYVRNVAGGAFAVQPVSRPNLALSYEEHDRRGVMEQIMQARANKGDRLAGIPRKAHAARRNFEVTRIGQLANAAPYYMPPMVDYPGPTISELGKRK